MKLLILLALFLLLSISSETNADLQSFQQGHVLYNEARFAEAISTYQKIIKNNPQSIEAYLNLAYLYKDLAEYKQATDLIEGALQFSKDLRIRMLLSRLYYLGGKPREAIFKLKQMLPSYSEDPQVLFYLYQFSFQ